jgi:hypothetical protein
LPSPIFVVGLSTRVGEQSNCYSTSHGGVKWGLLGQGKTMLEKPRNQRVQII